VQVIVPRVMRWPAGDFGENDAGDCDGSHNGCEIAGCASSSFCHGRRRNRGLRQGQGRLLAAPGVLVESWESGRSLSAYCRARSPVNTQLVGLGVDAYLAMLLRFNFVHTDLHPGG
jgi:hypothetical protein